MYKAKLKACIPNLQHFLSLVKFEAEKEEQCAITKKAQEKLIQKCGVISETLVD